MWCKSAKRCLIKGFPHVSKPRSLNTCSCFWGKFILQNRYGWLHYWLDFTCWWQIYREFHNFFNKIFPLAIGIYKNPEITALLYILHFYKSVLSTWFMLCIFFFKMCYICLSLASLIYIFLTFLLALVIKLNITL